MTDEIFEYLRPYRRKKGENSSGPNDFWPVSEKELIQAEEDLNITFPLELRTFYKNIGYGFLSHPHIIPEGYRFSSVNRINPPSMVADIMINGPESGLIIDSFYELLEPGDLPFFEMYDSSYFLIMKCHSENPNAVWSQGLHPIKIEDSFEKFIWRLYYENPGYYGDVIEQGIINRKNKPS